MAINYQNIKATLDGARSLIENSNMGSFVFDKSNSSFSIASSNDFLSEEKINLEKGESFIVGASRWGGQAKVS